MALTSPIINLNKTPDAFLYIADEKVSAYGIVTFEFHHGGSEELKANNRDDSAFIGAGLGLVRDELKKVRDAGAERSNIVVFVVFNRAVPAPLELVHKLREALASFFQSLRIRAYWKSCKLDPNGLSMKLSPDGHSLLMRSAQGQQTRPDQQRNRKLRVLVVDDSKVIHKLLGDIISKDSRFEVCGYALDPIEAESKIDSLRPDVLTLDFQMPRMDGLSYLQRMIPTRHLPVVMISGASSEDGRLALQALEYGAFDFIQKPSSESLEEFSDTLCEKIFAATQVNREKIKSRSFQKRILNSEEGFDQNRIVLIGASTGGTVALSEIISTLPADFPPVVIVQHIPERFSMLFAERLDKISAVTVKEASHGDVLQPGCVFIAPGGRQLKLVRSGRGFQIEINDDPPLNRHKPSVDYMFYSASNILGPEVVAVLLTGMGKDGAQGLYKLKENGAYTIAQDAESCVVYGMPKAAAEIGAAQAILPLERIAGNLIDFLRKKGSSLKSRWVS